jgi:hypothetical protein
VKLSERLLQQQRVVLDTAPLKSALRQLRRAIEKNERHVKLYAESLARRNTIAVATLDRGDDGMKITVRPSRELAMFLQRTPRNEPNRQSGLGAIANGRSAWARDSGQRRN